jgi:hypothetical protein
MLVGFYESRIRHMVGKKEKARITPPFFLGVDGRRRGSTGDPIFIFAPLTYGEKLNGFAPFCLSPA